MRQTRAAKTKVARRRTATPAKPDAVIVGIIAEQDEAVRLMRYEFLGRILEMHTDNGVVHFRKDAGPALVQMKDGGGPAFVGMFTDLPALRKPLDEPCPDCLAKCDECTDGQRDCSMCGGTGKDSRAYKVCSAANCMPKGRANPKCRTCYGAGTLPNPDAPCKGCKGSKRMQCGLCFGTAKMATGKSGGSAEKTAPDCKTCDGHKRRIELTPQDMDKFVAGRMEGRPVLGPIHKFVLHVEKLCASFRVVNVGPDSEGNYLGMLIGEGGKMYAIGGKIL